MIITNKLQISLSLHYSVILVFTTNTMLMESQYAWWTMEIQKVESNSVNNIISLCMRVSASLWVNTVEYNYYTIYLHIPTIII